MKKDFISVIALIFLGIVILMLVNSSLRKCSENYKPRVVHDTTIVRKWLPGDTVWKSHTITKPEPVYITEKLPPDTVVIDSGWFLKDYFREKLYIDTTKFDSSAIVITKSWISWNDLDSLNVAFKWLRATTFIYPEKTIETKYTIYGQMQLGFGANKFALPIGLTVARKKDLFGADYDFINKMIYLRYGIKLYSR